MREEEKTVFWLILAANGLTGFAALNEAACVGIPRLEIQKFRLFYLSSKKSKKCVPARYRQNSSNPKSS